MNPSADPPVSSPPRGRILVTPRSVTRDGHPALARLEAAGYEVRLGPAGRQPTRDELLELLPGCVGYLAGVEPVDSELLRTSAQDGLAAIARNGTGVDNVDLAAADALGIRVLRAEGANARGVAELAWGLVLALARSIPASDAALKRSAWERRGGSELESRTLGLIGCGTIGRLVAGFGSAFGMKVVACDPFPDAEFATAAGPHFRFASLNEVLEAGDIVSLHCPPAADGRPLIDAESLTRMPRGALLVNTARAELIDDAAVLAALDSGQLGGYATDVFRTEPPGDEPLVVHPRVVATPHLGGFTRESIDRAVSVAVAKLLEALSQRDNSSVAPSRSAESSE